MEIKRLIAPLTEEVVRSLKVGDLVTIDGLIFSGRESFYLRAVEEGIIPPVDYSRINVQFHVGPVMQETDRGWEVLSLTPTTSIRMEKYAGQLIEKLGTRVLIGKGTMAETTAAAMSKYGCVHLTNVGIIPCVLADSVRKVVEVHYVKEIGPTEATWVYEVEKFGPFLVDMDTDENNYFDQVRSRTETLRSAVMQRLGVPEAFEYTAI